MTRSGRLSLLASSWWIWNIIHLSRVWTEVCTELIYTYICVPNSAVQERCPESHMARSARASLPLAAIVLKCSYYHMCHTHNFGYRLCCTSAHHSVLLMNARDWILTTSINNHYPWVNVNNSRNRLQHRIGPVYASTWIGLLRLFHLVEFPPLTFQSRRAAELSWLC